MRNPIVIEDTNKNIRILKNQTFQTIILSKNSSQNRNKITIERTSKSVCLGKVNQINQIKMLRKIMQILLSLIIILGLTTYLFLQQKVFGKNPTGTRLTRIEKSPNYRDGFFQNQSVTEVMSEGASTLGTMCKFLNKTKNVEPQQIMPSIKLVKVKLPQ